MKKIVIAVTVLCLSAVFLFAEEGGFGFDDSEAENKSVFSVDIGGKFQTGLTFFFEDFKNIKKAGLGLPLSGNLYVKAESPLAEARFEVRLNDKTLPINLGNKPELFLKPLLPLWIEEGYMQILTGPVIFGGGIKKLNWAAAGELSVLDIVNPVDYSNPSERGTEKTKIPQPLFYLSSYLPKDMKLEFVFLPVFEGHRLAVDDKFNSFEPALRTKNIIQTVNTGTLEYFQGGARYTVQTGSVHDIGIRYFYGFLPQPAFKIETAGLSYAYNRYHHIGFDYGMQIGSIANLKTEIAANITQDIRGEDPYIYNPNIAWTAGFDFSVPHNIAIRIYGSGTVRLFQTGSSKDLLSSGLEKTLKPTDTKLKVVFSQKVLRSSLEWKIALVSGIEDGDFLISPGINWLLGSVVLDAEAGFFGGKENGKLGRYRKNNFIKISVGYEF